MGLGQQAHDTALCLAGMEIYLTGGGGNSRYIVPPCTYWVSNVFQAWDVEQQ